MDRDEATESLNGEREHQVSGKSEVKCVTTITFGRDQLIPD